MKSPASVLTVIILLLTSTLSFFLDIQPVIAIGTVYIRADGSIEPEGTPILTPDNVTYMLTGDIQDSVVVERDNIVIDGAGYMVQGTGEWTGIGIDLTQRTNVTIRDVTITRLNTGIRLVNSSNNCVLGSNITLNAGGISLYNSEDNRILDSNMHTHHISIGMNNSSHNMITGNTISASAVEDIHLYNSPSNTFYHNNFIDFYTFHAVFYDSPDTAWDNGCEGNYWGNYGGSDSNNDGIGDTAFTINENNTDLFPLMNVYWNPGDLDHDLDVDIFDVVKCAIAYGSTPLDPNWNPHCDIAEPYGVINIFDIVTMAISYGEEYTP